MNPKIIVILSLLWLALGAQAQVIERHGEHYKTDNATFASTTAFRGYIKNTDSELFEEYNKGYKVAMSGWGLFSFGVVAAPVSAIMMLLNQDKTELDPLTGQLIVHQERPEAWFGGWVTCLTVASAAFCASIPLLGVGYHRMHKAVDVHNAKQTGSQQAYWSVEINPAAIGLAYHF